MAVPRIARVLCCAALAACHEVVAPATPTFTITNPEIWVGRSTLRLVSPSFAAADSIAVVFEQPVYPEVARRGDTLFVTVRVGQAGTLSVSVDVDGGRSISQPITVNGVTGWTEIADWVTKPLPVGSGSTAIWVGTARGLGTSDLRWPTLTQMVDTTVDPSCLAEIGRSGPDGIIVADKGCGVLRARRYGGAAAVEIDSGPSAVGYTWAAHAVPGIWLLATWGRVSLAVRSGAAWTWTTWDVPVSNLVASADSRLVAATACCGYDLLMFDLEHGTLLYRDRAGAGAVPAFTASGDTIMFARDTMIVWADSRTGVRLDSVVTRFPGYTRGIAIGGTTGTTLDPHRPWLYGFNSGGCPAMVVVDRRTWLVEAVWGFDCAGGNDVMVFSSSEPKAWIVGGGYGDTYIVNLTVPEPMR